MLTFLDLLIVVSMVLIAASFLSVVLMFLVKNQKFRRVCFYITVALSLYVGYVGFQINWPDFTQQAILAVVLMLAGVGAVVLERVKKDDDRMFLYARIAAAAALFVGTFNALFV